MDSRVRIVPAQFKHINRIARRIRVVDREECEAMGRTPKQSLRIGFFTSDMVWTALVDGKPEAMFGGVTQSALSREVTPWFLGTEEVYRHGREMLMWGPGIISRLCDSRGRLSNVVSSRNSRAVRLLKRWGFTVGEEVMEFRGVPFLQFEKEVA